MRMADRRRWSRARRAARMSASSCSLSPIVACLRASADSYRIASRETSTGMAVRFELGDPAHPRGHALLFFRNASDQAEILATYVIVLPIAINPAKYIPPAFAARMQQQVSAVAATALPPIP